jgi:hypothetical protein
VGVRWEAWRERFDQRRERRLNVEERETREINVTVSVSVDPSWTDDEVIGEFMRIFDESLYEDSDVWVKQVKLNG